MSHLLFLLNLIILPFLDADEVVWATDDSHGTRAVPIYYIDDPITNQGVHVEGLWNPNDDIIQIKIGHGDRWIQPACSLRMHEILHAWGYDEVELNQFNCPNPNVDDSILQYNEGNVKHWNPTYTWKGHIQDPACQTHNQNKPDNCGMAS